MKPYHSLDTYFKNTYGEKCYKIALDAGMTCPNRDGTLDTRGCIFCSAGGSGDFAIQMNGKSISQQLEEGRLLFGEKNTGNRWIAYFQAYTNTYAPIPQLEQLFSQALEDSQVCGISIATRPDCLGKDVLALLRRLMLRYPSKFIWIELGLQTMHDSTAKLIRRGYELEVFENACKALHTLQIPCIVHVILGLPNEEPAQMYETVDYLNHFSIFGIKFQLLHILKNTDLAEYYANTPFHVFTMEEYLDVLIGCIERLSPDVVIHRVTGDGPKELLIEPLWSTNKRKVLNTLHHTMKLRNTYQGRLFK